MKKTATFTFAALAVLAAVPGIAQAQSASARQACRGDFSKLCSGVSPGGGRVVACLKGQADKLSPECRDALKASNK
jgi:hypothetical protein